MRRMLLPIAVVVILSAAGISAFIWAERRALSYNEEGRFFDESTATVLHEQSISVYAILAVALGFIGVGLAVISRRR